MASGTAAFGGVTDADALLDGETEGFAILATKEGGQVSVIDTGTPLNDLSNEPFATANLVNNSTSAKSVIKSDLTLELTSAGDIPQSYDIANSRYGILVEPAATNIQLRSQEFDSAQWNRDFCNVLPNTVAAPDGTTTADTLDEEDQAGKSHGLFDQHTLSSGATFTSSVFAKAGTRDFVTLGFGLEAGGHAAVSVYELTGSGSLGQTFVGGTSGTIIDRTITSLANGWYHITLTASVNSGNPFIQITPAPALTGNTFDSNGNIQYDGEDKTIHLWGAQIEAGEIATSYIPTTTTTVTRAVDDITVNTSTIPFSQNPGTMYVDYAQKDISTGDRTVVSFNDGTDEDDEVLFQGSTADPLLIVTAAAVGQVSTDLGTLVADQRHQLTASWDTNDVDGSLDGAAPTNDAAATMPTGMDELGIGNEADLATPLHGHIYRFVYVPRHVENDDGDMENWRYNT